jgi:putative FmdB family regulatory protein
MPIYEFHCTACDNAFEVLVRRSAADSARACPQCDGGAVRVMSAFAARTKAKTRSPEPVDRNRPGRRVELPADAPKPPVELGPPPPLPEKYVHQLKHHGHC